MTLPHLRVDPTAFRPTVSESPALLQRSACGHSKLWALYQALAVSPEAGRLSNLLLSACTAHAPPPASARPPLSPPTHSGQKWGRANRKRAKKKPTEFAAEEGRGNTRPTMLAPQSLRKAAVPPALLSDPTPGSLQPTRLAIHVRTHARTRAAAPRLLCFAITGAHPKP